jgi:hypothetical protein
MKVFNGRSTEEATRARIPVGIPLIAALLTAGAAVALAIRPLLAGVRAKDGVAGVALQWFGQMQTGQIDRTQLSADYSAQLTDRAVQQMAGYLKAHDYGTPPMRAEVVRTGTIGKQTLYVVKLVFPRGDAASLLLGFNAEGKITGISLLSMAGD